MPKITIHDLTNVMIDDEPRGGIVDILFHAASKDDEELRAPLLDALMAWHDAAKKELSDSSAETIAKNQDQAAATVEQAIAAKDEEIAGLKSAVEAIANDRDLQVGQLTAQIAALEKDIAHRDNLIRAALAEFSALGGVFQKLGDTLVQATVPLSEKEAEAREKEKAELLERIAQLG